MVTVSEIEAAMEQLPRLEQESLLACLLRKLGAPELPTHAMQTQREIWLQQLDQLRAKGATLARRGTPLQELLDEIRAEGPP